MESESFKKALLSIVFFFLLTSYLLANANNKEKKIVAILYSSTTIQTESLYKEIISGIHVGTDLFTKIEIKITPTNKTIIKNKLLESPFYSIITLDNEASELALSLPLKTPIITLGLLINEKNRTLHGVSLSLEEKTLKKHLHRYLPQLQTVHIADSGSNINYFSNSTDTSFFRRKKITDTNKQIKYLWSLINTVDPKTEAIWINSSIDPEFVYQLSERAWERKIPLLSSNISHLEQGIVFVFFPNFNGMGEMAGQLLKQKKSGLLEPLTTIYHGTNLRTAKHLEITPISEKEFKVVVK